MDSSFSAYFVGPKDEQLRLKIYIKMIIHYAYKIELSYHNVDSKASDFQRKIF